MTLSEALTAERERQGASLNEIAKRAGVPYSRAHGVFGGKTPNPGFTTVTKLVAALGKTLAWLEGELKK